MRRPGGRSSSRGCLADARVRAILLPLTLPPAPAWRTRENPSLAGWAAQFFPRGVVATRARWQRASTRTPQAWAPRYWRFKHLTQNEARNLLCGLPPDPPNDTPVENSRPRTPKTIADDYVRDELRRVTADRHMRDAIRAGELKALEPPDERLLETLKPHLRPEEVERVAHALAHDASCSQAYVVASSELERWTRSRPDLFPDCPLPPNDLPALNRIPARDAAVSDELKKHRRALVRGALEARSVNQKEFCHDNGIGPDTLRVIVIGDRKRYAPPREEQLLKLLGLTRDEWNTPPSPMRPKVRSMRRAPVLRSSPPLRLFFVSSPVFRRLFLRFLSSFAGLFLRFLSIGCIVSQETSSNERRRQLVRSGTDPRMLLG